MQYAVERVLELDAGHRVPAHEGHCKHLHGHRYKVLARFEAGMPHSIGAGANEEMLVDFGFIKDAMVAAIKNPYDHRLLLWEKDPMADLLTNTAEPPRVQLNGVDLVNPLPVSKAQRDLLASVVRLPVVPTAEALARYWYMRLLRHFTVYAEKKALFTRWAEIDLHFTKLTVWETPNCFAEYHGQDGWKW